MDLRGNISSFIAITDGKVHDANILDVLIPEAGAIYIMDKACPVIFWCHEKTLPIQLADFQPHIRIPELVVFALTLIPEPANFAQPIVAESLNPVGFAGTKNGK